MEKLSTDFIHRFVPNVKLRWNKSWNKSWNRSLFQFTYGTKRVCSSLLMEQVYMFSYSDPQKVGTKVGTKSCNLLIYLRKRLFQFTYGTA